MPTIGTDCHITLSHPDINSGNSYGFLLVSEKLELGPSISVQRSVNGDEETEIRCYFTVLLANDLIQPNGKRSTLTRSAMYAMLTSFLEKTTGLMLESVNGLYVNLGASGHSATEIHFSTQSFMSCMLNNAGTYWPPVDIELFNLSVWDGTLTWATSYWR